MFAKSWLRQRAFNQSSFQPTFVFQEICMPSTYLRLEVYCTIAKNRNLRISYMATRLSMADTVTKDEFLSACKGSRKGNFAVFMRWSFQSASNGGGMQQAGARAAAAKNIKPCVCVFTLGWWLHTVRHNFEFHNHQLWNHQLIFQSIGYLEQVFFKENVRYAEWTCRDPISLILGTRFSLILGTQR